MWPYWFLFSISAIILLSRVSSIQPQNSKLSIEWLMFFILLVGMIGLRHEVGGDWRNDWQVVTGSRVKGASVSLEDALRVGDIGYILLVLLVNDLGFDVYTLDVLSALPFAGGLIAFCRSQPRSWLAMVIAIPYLVIVVAMGYTRQSVAIGFVMLGLVALTRGSSFRFVLWLALAATFHKSAVVLLPLGVLGVTRHRVLIIFWVIVSTLLLFLLLLRESVDALFLNYVVAEYNSQGARIRVVMNALPALLFLLLRRRFILLKNEKTFWTWMSWGGILFVGLLAISPSSTAVDRMALYWIPLQLFVFSRLPDAIVKSGNHKVVWVYLIVAYSALVQFVWLFFAQTAYAWLPYQFYPWVWLWPDLTPGKWD